MYIIMFNTDRNTFKLTLELNIFFFIEYFDVFVMIAMYLLHKIYQKHAT